MVYLLEVLQDKEKEKKRKTLTLITYDKYIKDGQSEYLKCPACDWFIVY